MRYFSMVGNSVYVSYDRTICIPKTRFRIIWIIVKDQYTCLEETCGFLARNPILKEPKTIAPNCDFSLHKHIPLFYMPVSDENINMVLIKGCTLFIFTALNSNSDIYKHKYHSPIYFGLYIKLMFASSKINILCDHILIYSVIA